MEQHKSALSINEFAYLMKARPKAKHKESSFCDRVTVTNDRRPRKKLRTQIQQLSYTTHTHFKMFINEDLPKPNPTPTSQE